MKREQMPTPTEHAEQCQFVLMAEMILPPNLRPLLWAIPNGGDRHPAVAQKLKAEGVKRGVPDLFFSYPCGGKSGLFIEMKKRSGGVVSGHQKQYIEWLRNVGYRVEVCKGCDEAIAVLKDYIGG